MRQRVVIAIALALDPKLIIMDEPTTALDVVVQKEILQQIARLRRDRGFSILFITHDLNEALRIGDRVCIMKDGAVVQIGTPEEILPEPATGYVAEFVQDVDQGRVIECHEVMIEPKPVAAGTSLQDALRGLTDRDGAFVLDSDGRPTAVLPSADGSRAASVGSTELEKGLRTDFERCGPHNTLNEVYAAAGRGLPIAVVDDDGKLIGNLDPRHIMEEMGRVEGLIDGFEREVFM